jgi:hypothetical protein
VIGSLKAALKRCVDVNIVYHDTSANNKAITIAELSEEEDGETILFKRTRPQTRDKRPTQRFPALQRLGESELPSMFSQEFAAVFKTRLSTGSNVR